MGAWLFDVEGGYGPRYEITDVRTDARRGFNTHDVAHAGVIGLSIARAFGPFLTVASTRFPAMFAGEWTLGLGAGFEIPVRATRIGALATVGYGGCECRRLQYSGAFARAEATIRYRVLEDAIGNHPLPDFDVFFGASMGVTVMRARYPDMSQYGLHLDDVGTRVGPHVLVSAGFEL